MKNDSWAEILAGCLARFIVITGVAFLVFALLAGVIALPGWIIQLLWNWVIVSLFNVEPITFWLGVGIALVSFTVGGFFKSSTSSK